MQFYSELIRTVFQALDNEGRLRNRIVAFTASAPGAGVSYVVNTLAKEIATLTQKRVLAVDSQGLRNIRVADPLLIAQQCSETQIDNLLTLIPKRSDKRDIPTESEHGPKYFKLRPDFDWLCRGG